MLSFLLIGAIAGWLAGRLIRGGGLGPFANIAVGIASAFAGGFLFGLAPLNVKDGLIGAPIAAAVGAALVLLVVGRIKKARS